MNIHRCRAIKQSLHHSETCIWRKFVAKCFKVNEAARWRNWFIWQRNLKKHRGRKLSSSPSVNRDLQVKNMLKENLISLIASSEHKSSRHSLEIASTSLQDAALSSTFHFYDKADKWLHWTFEQSHRFLRRLQILRVSYYCPKPRAAWHRNVTLWSRSDWATFSARSVPKDASRSYITKDSLRSLAISSNKLDE